MLMNGGGGGGGWYVMPKYLLNALPFSSVAVAHWSNALIYDTKTLGALQAL